MNNNNITTKQLEALLAEKQESLNEINDLLQDLNLDLSEIEEEGNKMIDQIYEKSKKIQEKLLCISVSLTAAISIITTVRLLNGNPYYVDKLFVSVLGVVSIWALAHISVVAWRIKKIEKSKELQNLRQQIEQRKSKIKTLTEKKNKTLEELAEITKSFVDKNNEVGTTSIQNYKNEVNEDIIEVGVEKHSKPYTRTKKKN